MRSTSVRIDTTRAAASMSALLWCWAARADIAPGADIRPVSDIRIDFVKPFGVPGFEDPAVHLATLEAAARDLRAALGTAADATLAPMPVRFLGTTLIDAGAVSAPASASEPLPPPVEFGPLGMRGSGATGAFRGVLRVYAERASLAAAEEARPLGEREALRRFADVLLAEIETGLELTELEVSLDVVDGVLHAPSSDRAATMTLPAVAGFDGIDAAGVRSLAEQVERGLESIFAVGDGSGATSPLEFTVRVLPAAGPSDRTLRLQAAFVGPKSQPAVPVSGFSLAYVDGAGTPIADPAGLGLPDPAEILASTTLALRHAAGDSYLVEWGGEGEEVASTLAGEPFGGGARLSVSALRAVAEGVLATLRANDLLGVYVDFEPGQFDMARGGIDTRGGSGEVKLAVIPGIVEGVRVVASGERVEGESAIDPPEPRYARIRERSPFGEGKGRILRESALDDYLHRLSRQPNRRVDAAVTPASDTATRTAEGDDGVKGTIGLDYLVRENKPWSVFVQGSNTGTGSTGEWQERFGVFHSDLLGNDEILSIEYLTTDFESMHSVNGYFDAPIGDSDRFRWKVYAGWYEYTASDVGLGGESFEGSSPSIGLEVAWNVFQRGRLFVDVVGGGRWFNAKVHNLIFDFRGEEDFLVPYVGVRVQRNARSSTTDAGVFVEACSGELTDASLAEMNALGRLNPDKDWSLVRWDLAHSFFLDPLLLDNPAEGTLAHELAFRVRGQHSFGQRLIPQQLGVAGGLYTVRGYPESIVAGDNVVLASAEYRLHVPQVLGFDSNPQPLFGMGEPFRLRPQFGYGSTDWDLILRAFVDVAHVANANAFSFESDETLVGAGVGIELQLRRNLDLRLDLGFPLNDLDGEDLDSARLSFVGTLAF